MSKLIKIRLFFSWLCVLFMSTPALMAQERCDKNHSFTLHYGINMPQSGNFITKNSFVAPSLTYLYKNSDLFETGVSIGFIDNKQTDNNRFSFGDDIISGDSKRKLTLIPIQAESRYFPFGKKSFIVQPYLGVAAGVQYAKFYITGESIQTSGSNNWAFAVTPQVGFRVNMRCCKRLFIDARAMWHYGQNSWTNAYTLSQKGLGIQVGLGLKF